MSRAIPVVKLDADALETMARKHVDRLMDELGHRCDMRAVVIVEFWARYMIDELPYGWRWVYVAESAAYSGSDVEHIAAPPGGGACETTVAGAWGAEYAARPRLDP